MRGIGGRSPGACRARAAEQSIPVVHATCLAPASAALALGYGLIGLAVAFCIARGLGVAVGLALVTRFFPLAWVPDLALAARLQRMAIPIGLSFLLTNTYAHVDTFLLKAFADYAQIGLYNVPLRCSWR
jgi:O-antigen/teichoic acid export membrane protein